MPYLKLGKAIPTGISGIDPNSSTEVEGAVEAVVRPFERTVKDMTVTYAGTAMLEQLFVLPMKFGLSIAVASTAMLVSPLLMVKQPETTGIRE